MRTPLRTVSFALLSLALTANAWALTQFPEDDDSGSMDPKDVYATTPAAPAPAPTSAPTSTPSPTAHYIPVTGGILVTGNSASVGVNSSAAQAQGYTAANQAINSQVNSSLAGSGMTGNVNVAGMVNGGFKPSNAGYGLQQSATNSATTLANRQINSQINSGLAGTGMTGNINTMGLLNGGGVNTKNMTYGLQQSATNSATTLANRQINSQINSGLAGTGMTGNINTTGLLNGSGMNTGNMGKSLQQSATNSATTSANSQINSQLNSSLKGTGISGNVNTASLLNGGMNGTAMANGLQQSATNSATNMANQQINSQLSSSGLGGVNLGGLLGGGGTSVTYSAPIPQTNSFVGASQKF